LGERIAERALIQHDSATSTTTAHIHLFSGSAFADFVTLLIQLLPWPVT
jgi:hypothetical protein